MPTAKTVVKQLFRSLGYDIVKRRIDDSRLHNNMSDVLSHSVKLGLDPATVIDVGVATGTPELYSAFPAAFHLLVEPIKEFEPSLLSILSNYKGRHIIAAAGSTAGTIEINVHENFLEGSSTLKEAIGAAADGVRRTVPTVRLDDVVKEMNLAGPFVLKVDVQGAELDVLGGALNVLGECELVLLEVAMFEFMKGGAQFYDVVSYMMKRGFVAYDIYGGTPRPLDGALGQIDMAFVKEKGRFRTNQSYCSIDQFKEMVGSRSS